MDTVSDTLGLGAADNLLAPLHLRVDHTASGKIFVIFPIVVELASLSEFAAELSSSMP